MKKAISIFLFIVIFISTAYAETRTYRQIKDCTVNEAGEVKQSKDKGNLFELTYEVGSKTIKRKYVKRLDGDYSVNDSTVYQIIDIVNLLEDSNENDLEGKTVIIAVGKPGLNANEMIAMSESDLLISTIGGSTTRILTGVYKRIK